MRTKLFIDGQWIAPRAGKTFDVIDPSNNEIFHQAPSGGTEDIDAAVQAARCAFDDGPWPNMSGADRAAVLHKMGDEIEARIDVLARLEVRDNGKPLPEAVWDIEDTAACFHFYADLAEKMDNDGSNDIALPEPRFASKVMREPVGVVGAIIPWNFPMLMAAWKIAPALAAGCSMVLKPSELTPLTALEYGDIAIAAGLPDGVLNIVTGFGPDAGQPLAEHADVDKLAFTGSVPTGSKIMQTAARDIKSISLELGGKSPVVVFADCDIEEAVEWILFGFSGTKAKSVPQPLVYWLKRLFTPNLWSAWLKKLKIYPPGMVWKTAYCLARLSVRDSMKRSSRPLRAARLKVQRF